MCEQRCEQCDFSFRRYFYSSAGLRNICRSSHHLPVFAGYVWANGVFRAARGRFWPLVTHFGPLVAHSFAPSSRLVCGPTVFVALAFS